MLKVFNVVGVIVLLLLLRKLPAVAVVLETWPGDPAAHRLAAQPGRGPG